MTHFPPKMQQLAKFDDLVALSVKDRSGQDLDMSNHKILEGGYNDLI